MVASGSMEHSIPESTQVQADALMLGRCAFFRAAFTSLRELDMKASVLIANGGLATVIEEARTVEVQPHGVTLNGQTMTGQPGRPPERISGTFHVPYVDIVRLLVPGLRLAS